MRLLVPKFIVPTAALGVLSLLAVVIALASVTGAHAQSSSAYTVQGQAIVDGRLLPDGTRVIIYVGGTERGPFAETKIQSGSFRFSMIPPPGQDYKGKKVEFAAQLSNGSRVQFPQTLFWEPGRVHKISLELKGTTQPFPQDPQTFPKQPLPVPSDFKSLAPHTFQGKVLIDGHAAQDGTRVNAFIDGVQIIGTRSRGGLFTIAVPQPIGRNFVGKTVEFRGRTPDGRGLRWPQSFRWQPGGRTTVALEIKTGAPSSPFPQQPFSSALGAPSIDCIVKVLGRIPRGFSDISQTDQMRIAQQCMSFGGGTSGAQDIDQERARLELERTLQQEQQALDKARLEAERELQEAQASLEQERLKQDRIRQEEQDRLDQERVMREQERFKQEQIRQEELDQARFEQEQQRLKREQELDLQQQKLEEDRRSRQRQQEDRDFKAQQERLRREVELNLQRQKFELEQRARQGLGLPPLPPEQFPPPGDGRPIALVETEDKGPRRGFFTNTTVGGLGTANDLMDPTMLAIMGIILTLGATMLQMIRGN